MPRAPRVAPTTGNSCAPSHEERDDRKKRKRALAGQVFRNRLYLCSVLLVCMERMAHLDAAVGARCLVSTGVRTRFRAFGDPPPHYRDGHFFRCDRSWCPGGCFGGRLHPLRVRRRFLHRRSVHSGGSAAVDWGDVQSHRTPARLDQASLRVVPVIRTFATTRCALHNGDASSAQDCPRVRARPSTRYAAVTRMTQPHASYVAVTEPSKAICYRRSYGSNNHRHC
jgi:hypothetical protein